LASTRSLTNTAADVTPPAPKDRPAGSIDGVELVRLDRLVDHRGSLLEALNVDRQEFWSEPVVHLEYITVAPGRIKGWGMHKRSHDRYVMAHGRMKLVLFDGRTESPTYENFAVFHLGWEAPGLVRIPAGVWHAQQNYGDTDAIVLVFPTRTYNHEDPDKYRIDPHSGEIPYDWSLTDG
jgi:dTDP-4-dehydrorhamnose 3,5-epimerase